VVTADVNKKVTLRLVDVPWDQALDLLIDTNGLGKEEAGNVVRISTAGQLKTKKTRRRLRRSRKITEPPYVFFNVNYAVSGSGAQIASLDEARMLLLVVTNAVTR
jgi:type IV pilus assembly protein PilQ